jgi:hypothetical protein
VIAVGSVRLRQGVCPQSHLGDCGADPFQVVGQHMPAGSVEFRMMHPPVADESVFVASSKVDRKEVLDLIRTRSRSHGARSSLEGQVDSVGQRQTDPQPIAQRLPAPCVGRKRLGFRSGKVDTEFGYKAPSREAEESK